MWPELTKELVRESRVFSRAYLTDTYIFNWQNQTFAADLIFVLPVALCLAIGLIAGHPAAGMIAAGGAMTVGYGSKQRIAESRLLPMILASIGIAFSIFIGMIAGHTNLILVPLAVSVVDLILSSSPCP